MLGGISFTIYYNISGFNNLDESIKIYPNPTNGLLTIDGNNTIKNISVIDGLGNQLLKVENNNNEVESTRLDLSNFAKGIYFIQIEYVLYKLVQYLSFLVLLS